MIEGAKDGKLGRRLRLGMVGGGRNAFIGAVHRIAAHIIRVTETSFEDFAAGKSDEAGNRRMLGIGR